MPKNKGKVPSSAISVSGKKVPRIAQEVDGNILQYWSFKHFDGDGPFGWYLCQETVLWLLDILKDRQGINWNHLTQGNKSHNIPVVDLEKNAQQRLAQLQLDDYEELFSMRITGKQRIFGIRDRNIFHVLWWDPNHQVCLSHKKNT